MIFSKETKILATVFTGIVFFWFIATAYGAFQQKQIVGSLFTIFQIVLYFLCGFFSIKKALQLGGRKTFVGIGLGMLGIGMVLMAVGTSIWLGYVELQIEDVPFPSLADIPYFFISPSFIVGLIYIFKATGLPLWPKESKRRVMIIIMLAIGTLLTYYFLSISANGKILNWNASWLENFLNLYYSTADLICLALIAMLMINSRRYLGQQFELLITFLFISLVILYVADFSFAYATNTSTYFNGHASDVLYVTSFTLIAAVLMNLDQGLGIAAFQRTKNTLEFQQFVRRILTSMQDMRLTLEEISREMAKQLKTGAISIYLRNEQTLDYELLFSLTDVPKNISRKDPIVYALIADPQIMVWERLMAEQRTTESEGKQEMLQEVLNSIQDKRFWIVAPIPAEHDFSGILTIGPKLLSGNFTEENLQIITQTSEDLADMLLNKYVYEQSMSRAILTAQKRSANEQ